MLPALGIALYNRFDLLLRCLRSVDVPVGHVFIVNNGPTPLPKLPTDLNPLLGEIRAGEPGQNLGVAGAWNCIQDRAFREFGLDAVLICGNDIQWQPGDLARVMQTVREMPQADFVFGNHAYSNFLVRRSGWEKIGAFDENIELAYLEDSDHWQRIRHTPARAIHAAGLNATHEGSATIKSDAAYAAKSSRQHELNWQYYGRKWGCPPHSHAAETFTTPFGQGGPVNAWSLAAARRERPHYFTHNPEER